MLPDITDLTFIPKTHQYILTQGSVNLQLPSVTQVIRFISNEIYKQVDPVALRNAADRGTRVHEAIEMIDQEIWTPIDDEIAGYVDAYKRWKNDFQPETIANEWRGYHRSMLYAGTTDKIAKLPGYGMSIVDYKTSISYFPFLVDVQLAGYTQMIESWPGAKIDSAWGLHLKANGSYDFHRTQDLNRMKSYFSMCYALHNAMQEEKGA